MSKSTAEIARFFDHTLLKPDATLNKIAKICQEARDHRFFGVCVNPFYAGEVSRRLEGSDSISVVVVGFPLGQSTAEVKAFETRRAIDHGAREIDTVINVGAYLSGDEKTVREDIGAVVEAAGKIPVKVILETGFLNRDQITEVTKWCAQGGAAYVKTSTGFGPRGASVEDIQTMKAALEACGAWPKVKIKAAGGVKTLADVEKMIAAGASRIGCSASVEILQGIASVNQGSY